MTAVTTATNRGQQALHERIQQCLEVAGGLEVMAGYGDGKGEKSFHKSEGGKIIQFIQTLGALTREAATITEGRTDNLQIANKKDNKEFLAAANDIIQKSRSGMSLMAFIDAIPEQLGVVIRVLTSVITPKVVLQEPIIAASEVVRPLEALATPAPQQGITISMDDKNRLDPVRSGILRITDKLNIPRALVEDLVFNEQLGFSPNGIINHNQAKILSSAVSLLRAAGLNDDNIYTVLNRCPELIDQQHLHDDVRDRPLSQDWALGTEVATFLKGLDLPKPNKDNTQPPLSARQLSLLEGLVATRLNALDESEK